MTAVATSHGSDELGNVAALTDGCSAAYIGAGGIAVVGALLAAALLRIPKAAVAADQGASEEELAGAA